MRRLVIAIAIVCISLLVLPNGASARGRGFPYTQRVTQLNDPGPYHRTYTSFHDGFPSCSSTCSAGWPYHISKGRFEIRPLTYRLHEGNRHYDYYIVDLTVTTSHRSGSKRDGYLVAKVRSSAKTNYATYSLGKSTVHKCKRYPLNIAAGWGFLSAGTTVAHFTVDCVRTWIHRKSIRLGQQYHVTNINGVRQVTFQRFVRVRAGVRPKFKLQLTYPTDHCGKASVNTGSGWVTQRWCSNRTATWSHTIGTRG